METRRTVIAIAVLGLWSFEAVAPCLAADAPQRWALLIGVDNYDYARGLKYCAADQKSLGAALVTAGFEARQVTLMTDTATDKKLRPSKTNLKTQVELLCQLADKGDFVLIGFSGHGVLIEKISYLCPSDAKLDDADTLISLDWVYKQLSTCKADLRLMMVDACRNVPPEPEGRRAATPKELEATSRAFVKEAERLPEGVLLLNSCSEGEFAQEHDPLGHGVFTHFLLEGLQGKADKDANKKISLQELFSYSSKETSLYVRDKFAGIQRPKLKGNLAVEALDYEVAVITPSQRPPTIPDSTPTPPNNSTLLSNGEKLMTSRSTGMKLALIPAGAFTMGSPSTEAERQDREGPQHAVQITRGFYMGVNEVTQGEYEQVMGTNPSRFSPKGSGSSKLNGQDARRFPVEQVSWYDAIEFCNKLSEKDGLSSCYSLTNVQRESGSIKSGSVSMSGGNGYRLPTEAEWEYACRGTTSTPFNFGSVLNGDKANVDGNYPYGTATKGKYLERTTTVGSYAQNNYGLYDMHGNVWEWCFDVYDEKAYGSRSGTTKDPIVTSGSEYRVLRGGSWFYFPRLARSAFRNWGTPDYRNFSIGFRVVSVGVGVRTP